MGFTDLVFFENDCMAERVSRNILWTEERKGSLADPTRLFRLWERPVPGTGLE